MYSYRTAKIEDSKYYNLLNDFNELENSFETFSHYSLSSYSSYKLAQKACEGELFMLRNMIPECGRKVRSLARGYNVFSGEQLKYEIADYKAKVAHLKGITDTLEQLKAAGYSLDDVKGRQFTLADYHKYLSEIKEKKVIPFVAVCKQFIGCKKMYDGIKDCEVVNILNKHPLLGNEIRKLDSLIQEMWIDIGPTQKYYGDANKRQLSRTKLETCIAGMYRLLPITRAIQFIRKADVTYCEDIIYHSQNITSFEEYQKYIIDKESECRAVNKEADKQTDEVNAIKNFDVIEFCTRFGMTHGLYHVIKFHYLEEINLLKELRFINEELSMLHAGIYARSIVGPQEVQGACDENNAERKQTIRESLKTDAAAVERLQHIVVTMRKMRDAGKAYEFSNVYSPGNVPNLKEYEEYITNKYEVYVKNKTEKENAKINEIVQLVKSCFTLLGKEQDIYGIYGEIQLEELTSTLFAFVPNAELRSADPNGDDFSSRLREIISTKLKDPNNQSKVETFKCFAKTQFENYDQGLKILQMKCRAQGMNLHYGKKFINKARANYAILNTTAFNNTRKEPYFAKGLPAEDLDEQQKILDDHINTLFKCKRIIGDQHEEFNKFNSLIGSIIEDFEKFINTECLCINEMIKKMEYINDEKIKAQKNHLIGARIILTDLVRDMKMHYEINKNEKYNIRYLYFLDQYHRMGSIEKELKKLSDCYNEVNLAPLKTACARHDSVLEQYGPLYGDFNTHIENIARYFNLNRMAFNELMPISDSRPELPTLPQSTTMNTMEEFEKLKKDQEKRLKDLRFYGNDSYRRVNNFLQAEAAAIDKTLKKLRDEIKKVQNTKNDAQSLNDLQTHFNRLKDIKKSLSPQIAAFKKYREVSSGSINELVGITGAIAIQFAELPPLYGKVNKYFTTQNQTQDNGLEKALQLPLQINQPESRVKIKEDRPRTKTTYYKPIKDDKDDPFEIELSNSSYISHYEKDEEKQVASPLRRPISQRVSQSVQPKESSDRFGNFTSFFVKKIPGGPLQQAAANQPEAAQTATTSASQPNVASSSLESLHNNL